MAELDLVVRGGTVHDGTGAAARTADVAVRDGVVVEVGRVEGKGRVEVDATGAVVTPGFVDIHTHYDGQATWDSQLLPSSWHGVTTVVAGNCGVGFAPVRRHDRDRLIELMEGVEDIPGTALHEGLSWEWESFADYLDVLEARPRDIDMATQVPHSALRLYVMGERGAQREDATADEIVEMGRLAADAVRAGALGFSTSRTRNHRTSKGEPTPTLTAARDELVGIAAGMAESGAGILQGVSDFLDVDDEFATFHAMVEASGRPLSVTLAESERLPGQWRAVLDRLEKAHGGGVPMRAQVPARAIGTLLGLEASLSPFSTVDAYKEIATLPFAERVAAFRDPARRERLLAGGNRYMADWARVFRLQDPPDYEPSLASSIGAEAARRGVAPEEVAYEAMLDDDGHALLYVPFLNWGEGNLDVVAEMLASPATVPGLSDGGAHVGLICDGSFPTTLLSHWGRDRSRGTRFDLSYLVHQQTRATAETVGLLDRGLLAPGYRGDVNVIDFDALRPRKPEMHHDLPAGGKRLLQRADGYLHTFVAGVETYRDGEFTGALPGRLVRGAQPDPPSPR